MVRSWFRALGPDDVTVGVGLAVIAAVMLFHHPGVSGFIPGHHGFLSSHGMTLASNVSASEPFYTFETVKLAKDGTPEPIAYNRFPWFVWVLIRLVMSPFDALAGQIGAAQALMRMFVVGAFAGLYMTARQLGASAGTAFLAAALAAAGYHVQYYGDMVFNDVPALCAFAWTLWAVLRARAGAVGFRGIALAGVLSVSVGWQPLAIWLTWGLVAAVEWLVHRDQARRDQVRLVALGGLVAVSFTVAVVGVQIWREWQIVGGALSEQYTVTALMERTGADAEFSAQHAQLVAWNAFVGRQLHRLWLVLVPLVQTPPPKGLTALWALGVVLGGAYSLGRNADKVDVPAHLLVAFCGALWMAPLRHFVAFHDFQSLFWIGVPLVAYSACLLPLRDLPAFPLVLLGSVILVGAHVRMSRLKHDQYAETAAAQTEAFQQIRDHMAPGDTVWVYRRNGIVPGAKHAVDFYLAGHPHTAMVRADWVVSRPARFPAECQVVAHPAVNLYDSQCIREVRRRER